jgi:hypothetical protein
MTDPSFAFTSSSLSMDFFSQYIYIPPTLMGLGKRKKNILRLSLHAQTNQ